MKQPIIQLKNVTFTYPGRNNMESATINDVSLDILEGQWISIVGPNGSGKSTLSKLMNGLLRANKGSITVNGTELTSSSLRGIRQQIGFIFQNPDNQFIGSTIFEDLVFGMENNCLSRSEMDERVQRFADKLTITPFLHRHPSELSGGQKQRAAIAAVLAMDPRIVIFDEATSMLDEGAKESVIELMRSMHASGQYTIISITHDMDEIIASDRVVAMKSGQIIADDSPFNLLQQEEIIEACRLKPPFYIALCQELRQRNIDIGIHLNERDLVNNLWQYISTM
ncbi:energy-coupling factor transporter ATPase [Paenibacillus albiflavus]|uniref:Energy-coupling factor transporter ATPase n=1 Tax=Paenibacillus albiflavus TaxID=2545760 RepID=A0A4R4EE96_9BACL|nr:energy-coupling factor transporter ATPase [Paenibacillus albiflavus]TCZ76358.1 energy-coupling factor transporter ATPase [Paenibacillus albiflavus]